MRRRIFPSVLFEVAKNEAGKRLIQDMDGPSPNGRRFVTRRPHSTKVPLAGSPPTILPNRHRRRGGATLGRSRPERRFPSTVRTVVENERGAQCVCSMSLYFRADSYLLKTSQQVLNGPGRGAIDLLHEYETFFFRLIR